ncbi:uncharacterized protein LOC111057360 isoform X2 [Nilaparvata lugens]|uniref:uncharacterized protein LOC111057360 isoform X3 n=1 Tax=Nilaparvata lugens TaxID=108931 RepID=UPI000B993B26|nr:uncharacterized protein LOC111057360 isoform X3 [Nilaparvata lugens]XP_039281103.1 uncharacterized protein LOC111057360 isoform X2 [Nilaparvata lugens]
MFKSLISFGAGFYLGIFYAQNNEVPKLDSPAVLWEKALSYLQENMEKEKDSGKGK